jgi:hypothetical protein
MPPAQDLEVLAKLYADVGGVADVREPLSPCLPRSKFDEAAVQNAVRVGFPAVEPILSHLLMWLQDPNWPIHESVGAFLRTVGEPLAEPIRRVLRSRDDIWKHAVLTVLVKDGPRRMRQQLATELQRLADHASEREVAEELPEVAVTILRGLAVETKTVVYENDDFRAWVDGASIQIKALTAHGDPVDFGTGEVRAIIAALTGMVKEIDGDED